MKKYQISEHDLQLAKEWTTFKSNEYTINKEKAELNNLAGSLGEIFYKRKYPNAKRISHQDKQADFISSAERVDVKTLILNRTPKLTDHFQINAYQIDFNCDVYYVYWYYPSQQMIFDIGYISKTDFKNNSIYHPEGTTFPGTDKIIQKSIYRIPFNKLTISE